MDIILNIHVWCTCSCYSKSLESLNMTSKLRLYSYLKNKDIVPGEFGHEVEISSKKM